MYFPLHPEVACDILEKECCPGYIDRRGEIRMEQKIIGYNEKLKAGLKKVQIYPWGWQDFDKIYVIPSIKKEIHWTKSFTGVTSRNTLTSLARELVPYLDTPEKEEYAALAQWLFSAIRSADYEKYTKQKGRIISYECDMSAQRKTEERVEALLNRIMSANANSLYEGEERRRQSLFELFSGFDMVYLVGGAGYGKSLFLRLLCVCPELLEDFCQKPLLILYGDLKTMLREDGSRMGLVDFLCKSLGHSALSAGQEDKVFVEQCLKEGRCLVLLDALDEVSGAQREELHDLILHSFAEDYPGNKVCITSRDRGFLPREAIICHELQPVGAWDVVDYVRKLTEIGQFPIAGVEGFVAEAIELVEKGFIKGFLTLSLLLSIYCLEGQLPKNKLQLYEKCFEYMARVREKEKDTLHNKRTGENYNWEQLDCLLTEESFMALARKGTPNNRDIPVRQIKTLMRELYKKEFSGNTLCNQATEEFLQFCADRTEVFVPSAHSNSSYRFFHRSFYEYFFVRWMDAEGLSPEEMISMLRSFEVDSEVYELIGLLYRLEQRPEDLHKLLHAVLRGAREELQQELGQQPQQMRCLDMLSLLLHPLKDRGFHHLFTDLVLEYGGTGGLGTGKIPLNMVVEILSVDVQYVQQALEQKGIDCLALFRKQIVKTYLTKKRELARCLEEKSLFLTVEVQLSEKKGYDLPELLVQTLEEGYQIYEDAFQQLENKTVLLQMGLRGRETEELRGFVKKVRQLSPKNRKNLYHYLLLLSKEALLP